MMAVTPICPNSLSARPWVLEHTDIVGIKTVENTYDLSLLIDGQVKITLSKGHSVKIKTSKYETFIVRTTPEGFYDILRRKSSAMNSF